MFNDLVINRTDTNGNLTQIVNVPLQYSKKEKMLTRVLSDPSINREDAIILPAISFEIEDIKYDINRKFNTMGKNSFNLSNTTVSYYNSVPYDVRFNLYVYVKNNADGTKIIEQIVPFFTPDFTIRAVLFAGMPSLDVPIILDGVALNDEDNEKLSDREIIVWHLGFTLKGNFYGPQKTSPVINFANVALSTWGGSTPSEDSFKMFGMDDLPSAPFTNIIPNSISMPTINN